MELLNTENELWRNAKKLLSERPFSNDAIRYIKMITPYDIFYPDGLTVWTHLHSSMYKGKSRRLVTDLVFVLDIDRVSNEGRIEFRVLSPTHRNLLCEDIE